MSVGELHTLAVRADGPVLHVTLNRPDARNAMSAAMVEELMEVFEDADRSSEVRVVVLRGAGGHFCAGGDVKDMAAPPPTSDGTDPVAALNRRFGTLLQTVDGCSKAVVAVCEGAVMGGGFGLACVSDVTLVVQGARFRLPETSLGIIPAQIAPFVKPRIGSSHARRLAVTGETLDAREAVSLHLAHQHCASAEEADQRLEQVLGRILRCEPEAVAATKDLVARAGSEPTDELLDEAAHTFSTFATSERAQAGFMAFLSKQPAPWVPSN